MSGILATASRTVATRDLRRVRPSVSLHDSFPRYQQSLAEAVVIGQFMNEACQCGSIVAIEVQSSVGRDLWAGYPTRRLRLGPRARHRLEWGETEPFRA